MQPIPLRRNNRERGSATILMVFMVTILMTLGLGFNWLVKEHLQASESLKNKAEAILMARSAYDTLIYLLLNGKATSREVTLDSVDAGVLTELTALPLDNSPVQLSEEVSVRLQDSNGLLSLSTLDGDALKRLIQRVLQVDDPVVPVAGLQDWTDQDDLKRLNGAESSYYKREGSACLPRNYPLQYMEELAFIRGISPEGYERLRPSLTLLPATGFNPNTAPDEVLMAYLDISEETLERIKAYKAEFGTITQSALYAVTGRKMMRSANAVYYTPSLFMDVTVSAGRPKAMYSIKAGLSLRQNNFAPYSVLYWREE